MVDTSAMGNAAMRAAIEIADSLDDYEADSEGIAALMTPILREFSRDPLSRRIASLERQLAEAQRERDDYREANESVAVCAVHVGEIDDGGRYANECVICEIADIGKQLAEARADGERG